MILDKVGLIRWELGNKLLGVPSDFSSFKNSLGFEIRTQNQPTSPLPDLAATLLETESHLVVPYLFPKLSRHPKMTPSASANLIAGVSRVYEELCNFTDTHCAFPD